MIRVRNLGRLGNNLFQFAFGYATARHFRTPFFMDDMGWFHLFENRAWWKLRNRLYLKLWREKSLPELNWTDNDIDPETRIHALQNHTSYRGYFHSEKYFLDYEKDIRKIFTIRSPFNRAFERKYSDLLRSPRKLVINYRGGKDFTDAQFTLHSDYYERAYTHLLQKGFQPDQIIVISNEIEEAKPVLHFLKSPHFLKTACAEEDFKWISIADANILSNSTFAWWAGWLNTNAPKTIAPLHWPSIGPGQKYLYHDRWDWL